MFDGSLDAIPASLATTPLTFTVTPEGYDGKYILAPLIPDTVDQPSTLKAIGPGDFVQGVFRAVVQSSRTR